MSVRPFTMTGSTKLDAVFEFPKLSNPPGFMSLRAVVGHYISAPNQRTVAVHQLYMILGRLRCLLQTIANYNKGISKNSPIFLQYWRTRALNYLSGFGFHAAEEQQISIEGLSDLIPAVESLYEKEILDAQRLIQGGQINFESLGELYRPETPVQAGTTLAGAPAAFMITDYYYQEHQALFGKEKSFHLTLESIVTMGDHFTVVAFTEILSSWTGVRTRLVSSLTYTPVNPSQYQDLQERGAKYVEYGAGSTKFLAYSPHAFFIQSSPTRPDRNPSWLARPRSSQLPAGGRVMIDTARGLLLGYNASTGADEMTLAWNNAAACYRQWRNVKRAQGSLTDHMVLWETVPSELYMYCWPALVGFSFTAKAWGQVLVSGLEPIKFHDSAFDQLVLSQERKQIIRALVRFGADSGCEDLVSGKRGGSIFLLHGPPGVGKTLTAEAVAEVLHRPLYSVTMGELGINAESLEARLGDILDLCAEWNAVTLLDEADVFLEERSSSDLKRNAMVCVMLRLLEYHPGILFLTTNRIQAFDTAIESRVTVAFHYGNLAIDARLKIWEALLELAPIPADQNIDYHALSRHELNGRQIKNTVRLAVALAKEQQISTLAHATVHAALEATSLNRKEICTRRVGE